MFNYPPEMTLNSKSRIHVLQSIILPQFIQHTAMFIAGARSQMQYIFYFKATLKLFKQMCSLFTLFTDFIELAP